MSIRDEDERRRSILESIKRSSTRNSAAKKSSSSRGKRNKAPEKQVQTLVLAKLRARGFFVHVVESKAVFSAQAGRFLRGQAPTGFPDIVGCTPCGVFVALELKSKGKRSMLREHQREFLIQAIRRGAYAGVIDGEESLELLDQAFSSPTRMEDCLKLLPKPSGNTRSNKFFEDLLSKADEKP